MLLDIHSVAPWDLGPRLALRSTSASDTEDPRQQPTSPPASEDRPRRYPSSFPTQRPPSMPVTERPMPPAPKVPKPVRSIDRRSGLCQPRAAQ